MLRAEGIVKRFGALTAIDGVGVEVAEHEIVGLVGPNGSGKSTLLSVLSGFTAPDVGWVSLDGKRLDGKNPWAVSRAGLRRTFQLAGQPLQMTALEVMLCGADMPIGMRPWRDIFGLGRVKREEEEALSRARNLLEELRLLELQHHAAGKLSGGQQKLLALGAALMARPRVLLLDEPTAGVNPSLKPALVERLRAVRARGTSILVVEHDMRFVGELCDRVYVLDRGKTIARCLPGELTENERVVEAYLGRGGADTLVAAGSEVEDGH